MGDRQRVAIGHDQPRVGTGQDVDHGIDLGAVGGLGVQGFAIDAAAGVFGVFLQRSQLDKDAAGDLLLRSG